MQIYPVIALKEVDFLEASALLTVHNVKLDPMGQGEKSSTTGKTGLRMVLCPQKDQALLHSVKLNVNMFSLVAHGK